MKDAWAKWTIFITPKTISSPAATMKRIAAVVMMSRASVIMRQHRSTAAGGRCVLPLRAGSLGLQVRTLLSSADIGKALDDLDAAISLHLTEIHRQRRVMLLRHRDLAARTVHRDIGESFQDGARFGFTGLFHGRLVRIDRFIFRHRKIIRGLQIGTELLLHPTVPVQLYLFPL